MPTLRTQQCDDNTLENARFASTRRIMEARMAKINLEELKTALKNKQPQLSIPGRFERTRTHAYRREVGKLLETFYRKAGLDIDRLNTLRKKYQNDLRDNFLKERTGSANKESAFRQLIEKRHKTFELFQNYYPSTFVTLFQPFFIWEYPQVLSIFIDSQIEPSNSSIRFLVNTNGLSPPGNDLTTRFSFFFLWENDLGYDVLVNAASILALSGRCSLSAAGGILIASTINLSLIGELSVYLSNDMSVALSQQQLIANMGASGEDFWDTGHDRPGLEQKIFDPLAPYNFTVDRFFLQSGQTAIFEVDLSVWYAIDDGVGDVSDQVFIDFENNEENFFVKCPYVELEIVRPWKAL
jgi:hypothetical protein